MLEQRQKEREISSKSNENKNIPKGTVNFRKIVKRMRVSEKGEEKTEMEMRTRIKIEVK